MVAPARNMKYFEPAPLPSCAAGYGLGREAVVFSMKNSAS